MSQYSVRVNNGNLPPDVPLTFTADDATVATAAANNINNFSNDSTANNVNGIQTTNSGSTTSIILTNRFGGAVTTTDGNVNTSILLALGSTPGVYTFDVQIAAFDTTDQQGLGYSIFGTVRTTGSAAVVVGTPDKIVNEENTPVDLSACDADIIADFNNAVIQLTGKAATNIDWRVLATYIFVS